MSLQTNNTLLTPLSIENVFNYSDNSTILKNVKIYSCNEIFIIYLEYI